MMVRMEVFSGDPPCPGCLAFCKSRERSKVINNLRYKMLQ